MRLNPPLGNLNYVLNQPLTEEEHEANQAMAVGFADAGPLGTSLLLEKPLDVEAGGYFHIGDTAYSQGDVFSDADDPGYAAIEGWLDGGTRTADCVARDEVGR